MALWKEQTLANDTHLGIWKIEEDEPFFLNQLTLETKEKQELSLIKGKRRLEWLASRYLVHLMLSDTPEWDRIPVLKDEFGKPHLYDSPFHLSFSHTHGVVTVIIAKQLVGIDIQVFVPKIDRIAHKFMRPVEQESLREPTRLEHLHFYWCAKEALYKAYGRRELDFCKHILVEPFDFSDRTRSAGRVEKEAVCQQYELYFERWENYFMAYCL